MLCSERTGMSSIRLSGGNHLHLLTGTQAQSAAHQLGKVLPQANLPTCLSAVPGEFLLSLELGFNS
jgi:hypothetical protein